MTKTITITQKKRARLKEWKGWVSEFIKLNSLNPTARYNTITYAAELLNDYYWRLYLDYLKPMLEGEESNLHFYKIISASELCVMAVKPLKYSKGSTDIDRKKLNAEFAFYVACSIILNWKIQGNLIVNYEAVEQVCFFKEPIDVVNGKNKTYPLNFRDEHIEWLMDINAAAPLPILSNSQTWRMCLIATRAVAQLKNKKLA